MYITANQLIIERMFLLIISLNAMISILFYRSYERVIHNAVHLPVGIKGICRKPASEVNTACNALKIIVFVGGGMFLDASRLVAQGGE